MLVFWAAIVFCVIYQALADDNVYVFAAHWGISEAVTNYESSQLNVVPAVVVYISEKTHCNSLSSDESPETIETEILML